MSGSISTQRSELYHQLVAWAERDDGVLALYVFGSRGRPDGLADERSDYDVAVVLRDDAVERFDRRWPYEHGAPVEIARSTLDELRVHAEPFTESAWARPLYAHVDLVIDKTGGEVARILDEKRVWPEHARDRIVREGLGAYVNSTYRALRYGEVGAGEGARLDAAESVPPLLNALFALDGRVRPFNKYLAAELPDRLISLVAGVLDGDPAAMRTLFREVEGIARDRGFGAALDEWEPDLPWLRGDAEYRC